FAIKLHPPTHSYTLSLHDALPIWQRPYRTVARRREIDEGISAPECHQITFETLSWRADARTGCVPRGRWYQLLDRSWRERWPCRDRKSTRLNSSHRTISYAVFCLK